MFALTCLASVSDALLSAQGNAQQSSGLLKVLKDCGKGYLVVRSAMVLIKASPSRVICSYQRGSGKKNAQNFTGIARREED